MNIHNTTKRDEHCRGIDFPAGKVVEVKDKAIAAKVLNWNGMEETNKKADADAGNKG